MLNANEQERSEKGYVKIAPKCDGRVTIIDTKVDNPEVEEKAKNIEENPVKSVTVPATL